MNDSICVWLLSHIIALMLETFWWAKFTKKWALPTFLLKFAHCVSGHLPTSLVLRLRCWSKISQKVGSAHFFAETCPLCVWSPTHIISLTLEVLVKNFTKRWALPTLMHTPKCGLLTNPHVLSCQHATRKILLTIYNTLPVLCTN